MLDVSCRRRSVLVFSWLSLCLLATRAHARSESPVPGPLWTRLTHVEDAFRRGDAAALRAACALGGKIHVEMRDFPSGQGNFGASQLEVIFRQIFKGQLTRALAFLRDDVKLAPPATAFARGVWVHRPTGGAETTQTLTFTLRAEGDDWRIQEIRSAR
jgi:hypothetical protein